MTKTLKTTLVLLLGLFAFTSAALALELPMEGKGYEAPEKVPGTTTVDTSRAHALWTKRAYFVDPRKDSDWEAGRIPGAIHLEYKPGRAAAQPLTADSLEAQVPKDKPVVFYCNGEHCDRSSWAAGLAAEWGWKQVYYFRKGFPAWKAAGYPVE